MWPKAHGKFVSLYNPKLSILFISSLFMFLHLHYKQTNNVWKGLWPQPRRQEEAGPAHTVRRRRLNHRRSSHNLPLLGNHKAVKAKLHPPGRNPLRIQPLNWTVATERPHNEPTGHDHDEKPKRQNRNLLPESWRLRFLPKPADKSCHIAPRDLPGPQGRHRLVPVSVR